MASFSTMNWHNLEHLPSEQFVCWNCGNQVASSRGYQAMIGGYIKPGIYICPHCKAPHIIDVNKCEIPSALPGRPIQRLPKIVNQVYEEARNCISAGAYTAAVMMLRKILMNLAVEEGAREGDSFAHYVDYLCDNGFVHRRQQEQAKKIQRLGNDANHKIESRTKDDAMELLNLVQLILINNYEQADEATNQEPEVVVRNA